MNVFKQLGSFYWPKRGLLFASVFCLIVATALGLVYPNLLRILIDDVIAKKRFELVPWLAITVVVVVSIKGILQFMHGFLADAWGIMWPMK